MDSGSSSRTALNRVAMWPSVSGVTGWPAASSRAGQPSAGSRLTAEALLGGRQIVEFRAVLAANAEDILQPFIGNQQGAGALAFQGCVGGHGGAVHNGQLPAGHGITQAQVPDALQDGAFRGCGCGQHFVDARFTVAQQNKISKSAAGIDAEPVSERHESKLIMNN